MVMADTNVKMNLDLFNNAGHQENICPGAMLLRGYALNDDSALLAQVEQLLTQAPPRRLLTPGGLPMSVATSSCGEAGWVSDAYGYRYTRQRHGEQTWPVMPALFLKLAQAAAATAGFNDFLPDSCLINIYLPGAKMSLHQDKNEKDFSQPIVSVSLGLPATFLLGGRQREHQTRRIQLTHGDVVVWGGPARLYFHGVLPVKPGWHSLVGQRRINLTFRKAL